MRFPISAAKARLADLVRRAEAGDEVVLTRHGHPVVRLAPVPLPGANRKPVERLRGSLNGAADPGLARRSKLEPA